MLFVKILLYYCSVSNMVSQNDMQRLDYMPIVKVLDFELLFKVTLSHLSHFKLLQPHGPLRNNLDMSGVQ